MKCPHGVLLDNSYGCSIFDIIVNTVRGGDARKLKGKCLVIHKIRMDRVHRITQSELCPLHILYALH